MTILHGGMIAGPKWSADFDTIRRERLFRHPNAEQNPYPLLAATVKPHIDSFNSAFADNGYMFNALEDIGTKCFLDNALNDVANHSPNKLFVRISQISIKKSYVPDTNKSSFVKREIFPSECRERHTTYKGRLKARLECRVNDGPTFQVVRDLGTIPIMVKSNKCHLESMTPSQLIAVKEEAEELGGYFIVNGIEKIIRLLIVNRRNFAMAVNRPSFANRGQSYTSFGIQIRSVRHDQTSITNVLHYLENGNITFRFSWRKSEYLVPVMMIIKALADINDLEIFRTLVGTYDEAEIAKKQFVRDRVEMLLRKFKTYNLRGREQTVAYLGQKFRPVLYLPDDEDNYDAGMYFLRKIVLPHLGSVNVSTAQNTDKVRMLLFMIRKLYAFVQGECCAENPDSVAYQEVLLGGFLYANILKERLEEWVQSWKWALNDWLRQGKQMSFTHTSFQRELETKILRKTNEQIGKGLEYFLSTGNLSSASGLDLQQTSGFTVVAEKINFCRFISHFRMIHRGSFFAELKTTSVRKLLPESWGYLCPVHTPDGAPCGLLNHLAHRCFIATRHSDTEALAGVLAQFGLLHYPTARLTESVGVCIDGRLIGYCSDTIARRIHDTLRLCKVEGTAMGSIKIPRDVELGFVPARDGGPFPGLYIFSQAGRMYRPVKFLATKHLDYIGAFEQPFLKIACNEGKFGSSNPATHVEYTPTNVLSILANMTPFSDFNQSPRNMYQCQMSKQTMGTPGNAIMFRTDNKMYRLQSGHTPVVRSALHMDYAMDNFPNGTNAVVAVISYTGYDMDDAMIVNKSGLERGFTYGTVYKTQKIDLNEESVGGKRESKIFGFSPRGVVLARWRRTLDDDGLPLRGVRVSGGDIIAAYHTVQLDPITRRYVSREDGRTELIRYKGTEDAYIDEVRLIGSDTGSEPCNTISIKYRVPRPAVIGDKFSSRHGQKGVCSQKWPDIDMPFSESGIRPDIIINPHAFPSRMTIGMFIESMAGKAGCLHGFSQDATPFQFNDSDDTAAAYFGQQLSKAGYNFYGNETMYSGITGKPLNAEIFVGVVYYQRLRHMVNDKFQVRTTGINNAITGQPIKGRQKGGGIRVGEMERDSLLAHGTSFLLQDRLLNCSDYTRAWLCRGCGSFLSIQPTIAGYGKFAHSTGDLSRKSKLPVTCKTDYTGHTLGVTSTQSALPQQLTSSNNVSVHCRRCARPVTSLLTCQFDTVDTWKDAQQNLWQGGSDVTLVPIPTVLRYLDVELASMGVRLTFHVAPSIT